MKRVGSKDCIDEYNNINRKKIYKTDKNDINSLLIQNKENNSMKNNKILIKKNSFKINSNTINKNGSPNKKKEKIVDNSDKKINIKKYFRINNIIKRKQKNKNGQFIHSLNSEISVKDSLKNKDKENSINQNEKKQTIDKNN